MPRKKILRLLKGGDRRTIGRADEVAAAVSKNLAMFPQLMKGLWSEDPLVRMRAADATEKITRSNPDLLRPYRSELLGLMAEAKQQEPTLAFGGNGSEAQAELDGTEIRSRLAEQLLGGPQFYS